MDTLTIDCEYTRPRFAAAYLARSGSEAAFIDCNTYHAVPILLNELKKSGLRPEDVRYVVITHIHLDHAGGASRLLEACPNAMLLAHPKAALHAIDPAKLVSSARKVYGDEKFDSLYGRIDPIPAARVQAMSDGEDIAFGNTRLSFLHTRGHANHHFCIYEGKSQTIFTGDSFGLVYPALQKGKLFILPSTSPTDFDAAEARKSVDRIVKSGARSAYPTHFGEVTDLAAVGEQLLRHLDWCQTLLHDAVCSPLRDPELDAFCLEKGREYWRAFASEQGIPMSADDWELLSMDLDLNASGIAHVARKKRGGR